MEKEKIREEEKCKNVKESRRKQEEDAIAEYNAMFDFKLNEDEASYTLIRSRHSANTIRICDMHNGLPVTSIGDIAFCQRFYLTNITIPNSVTSIGRDAFCLCISLTSITIPSSVTSIYENAFVGCLALTNIFVDENNAKYKSIDGNLYTKDEKTLICYAAGKTDQTFVVPNNVTSIGDRAFCSCDNLTSIIIPDSVTSIGYNVFSKNLKYIYCFDNFRKIKGIREARIKRRAVLYYRETKPKIKLFKRYWHYVDGVPTKW